MCLQKRHHILAFHGISLFLCKFADRKPYYFVEFFYYSFDKRHFCCVDHFFEYCLLQDVHCPHYVKNVNY